MNDKMNDINVVNSTVKILNNDLFSLKFLEFGIDEKGRMAVWIPFVVNDNENDLTNEIMDYSKILIENLLKNGLSNYPHLRFTIKKGE